MEERQELGGNAKETHGKETLNTEGRQRRTEGNVKKIEKNKWENRGKNKVISRKLDEGFRNIEEGRVLELSRSEGQIEKGSLTSEEMIGC